MSIIALERNNAQTCFYPQEWMNGWMQRLHHLHVCIAPGVLREQEVSALHLYPQ